MKQKGQFLLFTDRNEFRAWLNKATFSRKITRLQDHHTWEPSYNDFNGSNHFEMLQDMKDYHMKKMGYHDIAQNLTTFPDGSIAVCRPIDDMPAGILGANPGALCIENIGDFDSGRDVMTIAHKETIIFVNAACAIKFKLAVNNTTILYHHWFDQDTGVRTNGTGDTKTCPGTNFFGGNTVDSAQKFFYPQISSKIQTLTNEPLDKALDFISAKTGINKEHWFNSALTTDWLPECFTKIADAWQKDINKPA
ncbi:MAG: hypothetical protein Q8920_08540 [Bacillota bacterium]|nr:hypothetical protein [Bacillota bacterium]